MKVGYEDELERGGKLNFEAGEKANGLPSSVCESEFWA